jgi:alpha-L-arabinofuranosidase
MKHFFDGNWLSMKRSIGRRFWTAGGRGALECADLSALFRGDLSPSNTRLIPTPRAAERGTALATSRQGRKSGDKSPHSKTLHRLRFAAFAFAATILSSTLVCAQTAVIKMDPAKEGPKVNPRLYGIFLEEINHGVDGGLYGELVRNRGFEDSRPPEGYTFRDGRWRDARGFDSGFSRYNYTTNGIPFWKLVQSGDVKGSMHLETTKGITDESSYCMRLVVENATGGRVGVANEGFFGIGVKEGQQYSLSLYARGDDFGGSLSVRLEDASGEACSTEAKVKKIGNGWKQFKATVTATKTSNKARLVITTGDNGTLWLDFVSLFPKQTWKGRPNGLRPDIAQMIADLKPGFVRFPGGCVVEGGTIETAYDWKITTGPVEERQERWGPWNYRRTQGMGVYEYFQFCEDIGAEPLWVGFDGQTCIFREREHVAMEDMGWVRDNFLDLVEYANGSAKSKWGSLRAQAGRRKSFDLEYVEIGNENQGPEYGERYRYVHDAMKAKYPDIKYFADLSWTSVQSMGNAKWDIEDRHYYNSPRWFATRFNEYDARDRKRPPLYLGEVAVTTGEAGPLRGNLHGALAEGIFLMGCERNADTVSMVSYAPLIGHVEGRTELTGAPPPWHAMIYFDGTRAFGTVSYYLWKLFGENRPDQMVHAEVTYPDAKPLVVAGQVGVGTWGTSAEFKDVKIEKDGRTLYTSDFTKGTEGWSTDNGRWSVQDGVYRQERRMNAFSYFGEENWTDYTLTLKARKLSGGEGFMIVFGRKGADRYWWNLGGWGNQEHGIEVNQSPVGQRVRGTIETNRWYDIKVELNGRRIRCYLDGQLLHDAEAPEQQRFFATAGRDEKKKEMVMKFINYSSDPQPASLDLSSFNVARPKAQLTLLTSAQLNDNNSLETPTKILPVTSEVTLSGNTLSHQFPANSFTVLRFKTK